MRTIVLPSTLLLKFNMLLLDFIGAATSLASTTLFITVNRAAWIITLLATLLNGYLYWQKGIYADMGLELIYFTSALYGWIAWKERQTSKNHIKNLCTIQHWLVLILVFGFFYIVLWYLLSTYTNTNVAKLDAATTTLSLLAQALMCRKVIETWILWFITDVIYAYLYYVKSLPFHASLALLYTVLAVTGYLSWQQRRLSQLQFLEPV